MACVGGGRADQDVNICQELLEVSQVQDQRDASLMSMAQHDRIENIIRSDKLVRGKPRR